MGANISVPVQNSGKNRLLYVMPGLDPGTSWRRPTGGLQPEVWMSPVNLLKGGTRIKSGYDEREVSIAVASQWIAYVSAHEDHPGFTRPATRSAMGMPEAPCSR